MISTSEQIQSGEIQLWHFPVVLQGVWISKRPALIGAAINLVLDMAASKFCAILLIPQTTMTFFGPKQIAATRLPVPSILTRIPSSAIAFALVIK